MRPFLFYITIFPFTIIILYLTFISLYHYIIFYPSYISYHFIFLSLYLAFSLFQACIHLSVHTVKSSSVQIIKFFALISVFFCHFPLNAVMYFPPTHAPIAKQASFLRRTSYEPLYDNRRVKILKKRYRPFNIFFQSYML